MSITKRIDGVTHIPEARRSETPPAPRSVKIELTGRCNYRCGFCALGIRESQPKADMDLAMFKRITRQMRDAGVEEVGLFFIGESFLAPDLLVSAIEWLKRDVEMPYVFLTSNASAATPEAVKRCMVAGLDSLKWSMNASDESQFSETMGVSPKLLQRALENVEEASYIRGCGGYSTRLYASSIRYDGEQQERMEALLRERVLPFVDEHYWLPLYSMGDAATARESELGLRPSPGNVGRIGALVDPLPCWSLFTEGHVLSDGRLSACCFDATGSWVVGDLRSQSFMEAWHSPEFRGLRKAHLAKDVSGTACERCVLVGA